MAGWRHSIERGMERKMRILLVRPMTQTRYLQALYPVVKVEPLALEYIGAGGSEESAPL